MACIIMDITVFKEGSVTNTKRRYMVYKNIRGCPRTNGKIEHAHSGLQECIGLCGGSVPDVRVIPRLIRAECGEVAPSPVKL